MSKSSFIDTGNSGNILCCETLNEISRLNVNNYKLKKTSINSFMTEAVII